MNSFLKKRFTILLEKNKYFLFFSVLYFILIIIKPFNLNFMIPKDNNLNNERRKNTYFNNMKINKIKYEYCNIN